MNQPFSDANEAVANSVIRIAFSIAAELAEARAALAEIISEEVRHEANLTYIKAKFQQAIIEATGGEKAFGANEDERKRKLVCELEMRAGFTHAREQLIETQAQRRLAEADCELLQHQIQILLAAINADVLHVPADWLSVPGASHGIAQAPTTD